MNIADYRNQYASLGFNAIADHVLEITLGDEDGLSTADKSGHSELTYVWRDIDRDSDVSAVLIRGAGKGFSAGGDFDLIEEMIADDDVLANTWKEARDLVYNLVNCSKPIVSAIHGPCVGAGLAVALLADVSVAAENARIVDGHTRLGVAAGDHAVIVWPLLCGLAKAKYYLLLNESMSGAEAERIGLVSLCVPESELLERAKSVAVRLAEGSPGAIRWTKYALNNWLRMAGPNFDTSLALEMLGFRHDDAKEGLQSLRAKRAPRFNRRSPL